MKLAWLVVVVGCFGCDDALPCSPEDEGETDVAGPTLPPPSGPGGPGTPDHGADPGESDGDEHGYSRRMDGTVCACDLNEAAEGGCSKEKPAKCDPSTGWDALTGECARETSGDAYFGKGDKPPLGKMRVWCAAWTKCLFGSANDPVGVLIRGRSDQALSEKNALLKAQRSARGNAIAECEINLRGRAASYTSAIYKCEESEAPPSWWNEFGPPHN